jgi:uncharacterized membrane protein YphA (DoxX/SURF4 family)
MTATSALARPMLAGMFVFGGAEALRDPKSRVVPADKIAPAIARQLGLPENTELLVRINGGVQVIAGLMLATGKFPRVASAVLATTLVPTTLAGHRFWEEQDPSKRHAQQVQFLKNTATLGGLLLATADTGGRPSVTWLATRQARRATMKARRATKASRKAMATAAKAASAARVVPDMGLSAGAIASRGMGSADLTDLIHEVAGGLHDLSAALQALGREAADALTDAAPKAKEALQDAKGAVASAAPKARLAVAGAAPKAKSAVAGAAPKARLAVAGAAPKAKVVLAVAAPKAREALHEAKDAVAVAAPKAKDAMQDAMDALAAAAQEARGALASMAHDSDGVLTAVRK